MSEVRIAAEPRTEFGKGPARRTRRAGRVPAVLYGHGTDPRHISLVTREFENALRTDGANVLLDLQLGDSSELALPKAVQRDPVRGGGRRGVDGVAHESLWHRRLEGARRRRHGHGYSRAVDDVSILVLEFQGHQPR